MVFQVHQEPFLQLARERLPDLTWLPRFQSRNPSRDGATSNLKQANARHPRCGHRLPSQCATNVSILRTCETPKRIYTISSIFRRSIADAEQNVKGKRNAIFENRRNPRICYFSHLHIPLHTCYTSISP